MKMKVDFLKGDLVGSIDPPSIDAQDEEDDDDVLDQPSIDPNDEELEF